MATASAAAFTPVARDAVAAGLFHELSPLVSSFDGAVAGVEASQRTLSERIETITTELERVAGMRSAGADAATGDSLMPYITKLHKCRDRMETLSLTLDGINARLNFLNTKLDPPPVAEAANGKGGAEAPSGAGDSGAGSGGGGGGGGSGADGAAGSAAAGDGSDGGKATVTEPAAASGSAGPGSIESGAAAGPAGAAAAAASTDDGSGDGDDDGSGDGDVDDAEAKASDKAKADSPAKEEISMDIPGMPNMGAW